MKKTSTSSAALNKKGSYFHRLKKCVMANKSLYLMILPVVLFYAVFHYAPMYGVIIAFKNFQPGRGILGSDWVGLKNFMDFFKGAYFGRVVKNTLVISGCSILFGFPAPILFALLMNEVRSKKFRSLVQTITYMPHFISLVVICGIIVQFTNSTGVITSLLNQIFGRPMMNMLSYPENFVPIYIISDIWQNVGWDSIIYLSAIASVNQELYEAAAVDGAGRFKQVLHITLPGILPTITIMLILRLGNIMSVGFEKIILLYNPAIYKTADVISSYTYRKGLLDFSWSYSTAVGLFNSVINCLFLIAANAISRKINDTSLW